MARASIKSYLIQSIWNWCNDYGLSPYIVVNVDDNCTVPMEFVQDGRIVFDISAEATHSLAFEEDATRFEARFGEKAMQCYVPYRNVAGMFPQEEPSKGMMFSPDMDEPEEIKPKAPTPTFSRVK